MGGSSRYAWATGEKAAIQEKGRYRRWGIIDFLGSEWDLVSEEEYRRNQPPEKNERHSWKRSDDGRCYRRRCFREPELEHV